MSIVAFGALPVAVPSALEFGTQSVVRVFGRSSQFLVVEFDRMCLAAEPHVPENEVSVQVMMPLAASDYIAVCYYRGIGALANSRADIRSGGESSRCSWERGEQKFSCVYGEYGFVAEIRH